VRRIPRMTLLVTMTAALALGTGGMAWAGASDETSEVTAAVNSKLLPADAFSPVQLFSQVTTIADSGPNNTPSDGGERVYIDYDNSIKFVANRYLAKCQAGGGTLGGILTELSNDTTQLAVQHCGAGSVVGSGAATARVAGELEFTVTAFNGPTSTQGGACTTPAPGAGGPIGCGFEGGDPTIILFARSDATGQSVPVVGEIQSPPATGAPGAPTTVGGDVNTRLAVTDAPDVAAVAPGVEAGAITLFNALVGKKYTNGKRGDRKRTFSYINAVCNDADKNLDYGTTWVYDDNSSETDTWEQDCATK